MAKIKNQHHYASPARIKEMKEELDFIGRWVTQIDPDDPGHLIVYALPPKRKTKKQEAEEKKKDRQSRRGNGYDRYKEMK